MKRLVIPALMMVAIYWRVIFHRSRSAAPAAPAVEDTPPPDENAIGENGTNDEPELAVKYLENLTKISRFDMLILCLPATEKADLCKTWDEVFLSRAAPIEYAEILSELRPKYCPGRR